MKNKYVDLLTLILFVLGLNATRCDAQSLVNTAHLNTLFRTVQVGGQEVGGIQIYAEYPDYRWVGDEDEGDACIDDAARALVFYCRHYEAYPSEKGKEKIKLLTRFVAAMQAENGYFYNFVFGDGRINKNHINSVPTASFWSWRAFWALSEVLYLSESGFTEERRLANAAIEKLLPLLSQINTSVTLTEESNGLIVSASLSNLGADQAGILLMALCNYYEQTAEKKSGVKAQIIALADLLLQCQKGDAATFPYFAFLSWKHIWHAWGNSQAYALLRATEVTGIDRYRDSALKEIDHFYPFLLEQGQWQSFSLIGLHGNTVAVENIQAFPQIAYGIRPMVFAAMKAWQMTKNEKYRQTAIALASWFLGENPAQKPMYDISTGRGYDGIQHAKQINRNAGAESTIESLLVMQLLEEDKIAGKALLKRNKKYQAKWDN